MEQVKQKARAWIYKILFSLLSSNKRLRDSFVLGLIIGYINPLTTRTMLHYLLSDVSSDKIDEATAANGILLSGFLLPRDAKVNTICLEDINPEDKKMCTFLNRSVMNKCLSVYSAIDIDSIMTSTKLILKKKNILSTVA